MTWFPIFGAGFLVGWWMCAANWPLSDRRRGRPPEGSYGSRLDPRCIQRGNGNGGYQPRPQQGTPYPPPSEP
jgi:hypothetical protein